MFLRRLCLKFNESIAKSSYTSFGVGHEFRQYASTAKAAAARPTLRNSKKIGAPGWLLLSVPIASFGLGTWQIERKKWKEGLIHDLMVKTKEPPVDLPDNFSEEDLKQLEYRRVKVKGRFDHSQEMYLGPRSCLTEGESKKNQGTLISAASGVSGYNVITPFILSGTNERILVNRGWVPFDKKKPSTRREGQIEDEVELVGVVRMPESRPQFTPHNKPDVRVWFSRDIDTMSQMAATLPIFLDASYETSVPGGPIGGQTRAGLRNEHMSYIITWYSLSAATAFMWYMRYFKHLK